MKRLSRILVLAALALLARAEDFSGKVVGITDGNTIKVMHNGLAERIRLWGIDCPESKQAFGTRAKQFTGDLAFGKVVTVHALSECAPGISQRRRPCVSGGRL